ncbi:ribosomal protein S29 [Acrasis kona]|uniref:Ribosomal protein S29 n=1 Tax=Acrasis kona TaxID=1008807 RepID=A0AAW2YN50_9EUKA
MGHLNIWHSHPKNNSRGARECRICANGHGLIRKYGLYICRQCFRENAKEVGFQKVNVISISKKSGVDTTNKY